MKRVGIYVRVSTQEQKQNGLSVDNQIDSLKAYATEQGYQIIKIYNDAGFSARKSYKKRPALLEMLKDCQDKRIDLLLFTRLDRFFRSVPDYYACIEQMNGVPWRAIWEDYETETSSGIFKVNIMLSIAQSEADRTSEKIKSVLEFKRKNGDYVGSAPVGYKISQGKLIKDSEKQEIVSQVFRFYLDTFSIYETIRRLNENGHHVARRTIDNILRNPTYTGIAKGTECEPYITIEESQLIAEDLKRKSRKPKETGRVYIFSGLLECPLCNKMLSAHYSFTPPTGSRKGYEKIAYICEGLGAKHHKSFHISTSKVQKLVFSSIDKELRDYNSNVILSQSVVNSEKKKRLEAKLQRIKLLFEDGDIEAEEYRSKRDVIKEEIRMIPVEEKREPIILPPEWKAQFDLLDSAHKQMFLRKIIKRIYISEDKASCRIDFF